MFIGLSYITQTTKSVQGYTGTVVRVYLIPNEPVLFNWNPPLLSLRDRQIKYDFRNNLIMKSTLLLLCY
jgi:hypothetical protein